MPKKIRPGQTVHRYTITDELSVGAMAIAYAARDTSGQKVFFKQYKSPSVATGWYRGYVDYQQELKRRVEASTLKGFCYRMIEFFEAKHGPPTFFQVFEFVEKGTDLDGYLQKMRRSRSATTWDQRVTLAKVLMSSIATLHENRIVHTDLKPENIQLFEDKTVSAGYRLKLIDMDFSTLSDIRAPWHGHQGYVGSPNYFSPEHLTGLVPLPASDVFTCGLMLYELLGDGHPYKSEDEDAYRDAALAFAARPPKFSGDIADGKSAQAADVIHACLDPNPAARPSARDVAHALMGRAPSKPVSAPVASVAPKPSTASASAPRKPTSTPARTEEPLQPERLTMRAAEGELTFGIRTEVGRRLVQKLGEDARFWSDSQFAVERRSDGWYIIPSSGATNETLVNGHAITEAHRVASGDVVAVGREAKGIAKLPLTVSIT